tara:strand:- start:11247 stop:11960 length:714 start_codon:yes stop_codon:yes gene_type:complete
MKTVLLTSSSYRHRYLSHILQKNTELKLILSETKGQYYSEQASLSKKVSEHFEKNTLAEKLIFGNYEFDNNKCFYLDKGSINEKKYIEKAATVDPEFIILFGTGILSKEWLKEFKNKIINIHLGLSPYYRGSATLFWPFFNNDIKRLGTTIHETVLEVDAGRIIKNIYPDHETLDLDYYQLTNLLIKKTIDYLPQLLLKMKNKEVKFHEQDLSIGSIYKKKDFCEEKLKIASRHHKF